MGYELEWDKDFFDIYLLHGDSQLLLNRFNGDKFGINTYYIPMLLSELILTNPFIFAKSPRTFFATKTGAAQKTF